MQPLRDYLDLKPLAKNVTKKILEEEEMETQSKKLLTILKGLQQQMVIQKDF